MSEFSSGELSEAHRAMQSTLHKREAMDMEILRKSQHTLLE
jgi:hypothetical protein